MTVAIEESLEPEVSSSQMEHGTMSAITVDLRVEGMDSELGRSPL